MGTAGIGSVIRDDGGILMGAGSYKIKCKIETQWAEVIGLKSVTEQILLIYVRALLPA